MITAEWSELHGAQLLTVAASTPADGDVAQETGRSIAAALEAL
jgi:hypothetical protein